MINVTLMHILVRKRTPLTTRSSSWRCVLYSRAPHCRTVLQNRQDKTTKASPKMQSIMEYSLGLSIYHVILKMLRLWEAAVKTERRCFFSKVILEPNVTPNITRSSDSFSTVSLIVNGGEWGWIVRDLETHLSKKKDTIYTSHKGMGQSAPS